MFKKIKESITKNAIALKAMLTPVSIVATLGATAPFVLAEEVEANAIIGSLLGSILTIASYIGILLLVWGLIMLVLAIRNEDADSKSRAVLFIVVAIVLIAFKSIFAGVLGLFTDIEIS